MTGGIVVPAGEHGVVRVFRLTLPDSEIAALQGTAGTEVSAALAERLFGPAAIVPRWTTLLTLADLGDMRLSDHLMQGEGLPEAAIAADRDRLDALRGSALIVLSRALPDGGVLSPDAAADLIGTYRHNAVIAPKDRLRSNAAEGTVAGGVSSVGNPKRQSGMVALVAIVVLLALVLAMVLVAS